MCSSNPNICRISHLQIVHLNRKDKNKEKEAGMGPSLKKETKNSRRLAQLEKKIIPDYNFILSWVSTKKMWEAKKAASASNLSHLFQQVGLNQFCSGLACVGRRIRNMISLQSELYGQINYRNSLSLSLSVFYPLSLTVNIRWTFTERELADLQSSTSRSLLNF